MPLARSLSSFKGKNILLITHSGCDVDAICAAASLFFFLKRKNRAEIVVPEHIALPAKTLAKRLGIPYRVAKGLSPKGIDCLFLVDFNELKMAGALAQEISSFQGQVFLVDHHRPPQKSIASPQNSIVDQNAVASCEIVFDWLKKSGIGLDEKTAACIAAGIVTDSAFFLTANSRTFAIMSEALEKSGRTFSSITSLFSVKQTFDEKVAKLKAAKRARIFLVSEYVVAASDVGSFEADAASALTRIGADIAFVGDSDEGKLRISGRASQGVVKKEGFDLAKHVFQKLPLSFGGSGGGHAGAAGFNGKGRDINAALMQCVSLTKDYFKKRKGYRFKEYT
jgi:nanoRNase/pAp phosphatase (c-di-AMP/oligoRNAs hydrolase)